MPFFHRSHRKWIQRGVQVPLYALTVILSVCHYIKAMFAKFEKSSFFTSIWSGEIWPKLKVCFSHRILIEHRLAVPLYALTVILTMFHYIKAMFAKFEKNPFFTNILSGEIWPKLKVCFSHRILIEHRLALPLYALTVILSMFHYIKAVFAKFEKSPFFTSIWSGQIWPKLKMCFSHRKRIERGLQVPLYALTVILSVCHYIKAMLARF